MNALVANAVHPSALAVIRSLGRKNIEVTDVSVVKNDFPLYSKYCSNGLYYQTKENNFELYTHELIEIVKKNHYDVFIPVMDRPQLMLLLKYRNEFEKYTKLALPSFDMFSKLNNKTEVARLLLKNNIPSPKTYFIDSVSQLDGIKKEVTFPVIVKPYIGEGAKGVITVSNPNDLSEIY